MEVTMPTTPRNRYTALAIVLHWLIAATLILQIFLGLRMGWAPKGSLQGYALFQLHKSVGITILLLSVIRLGWRLSHRAPSIQQPRWEAVAAKAVHTGFYLIMLGLPLTGWIMVSVSRTNIPTVLYGVIPLPHLPMLQELTASEKMDVSKASTFSHQALVYMTYALLVLHLGAVAKHQLLDRDAVFSHMAAGAKSGWREPRLWFVATVFVALLAFSSFYTPNAKPAITKPAEAPNLAVVKATPSAAVAAPALKPATPALTMASTSSPEAQTAPLIPTAVEAPVHWKVREGSSLLFSTVWSGQPVGGRFNSWTADILFAPTALDKSHLTVRVDVASISTGDQQRDATLPTEDWFNAAVHPNAVFTTTKFRKVSDGQFVADGILELRGVKKPIQLPFSLKIDGKVARVESALTLDRTAFGIGQGEWSSTESIPAAVSVAISLIADDVS